MIYYKGSIRGQSLFIFQGFGLYLFTMRYLFFFIVTLFFLGDLFAVNTANPPQSSSLFRSEGFTIAEITATAQTEHKWIMLYCTVTDNDACLQHELAMTSSKDFVSFVNNYFVAYKFDAFEEIEKTQSWDIRTFPTIIILNEKGELATRLEGKKEADEIVARISRIPAFDSRRKIDVPSFQKRGTDATVAFMDVNILKDYSISRIREEGFGLKVGTYSTLPALQAELNKIAKSWHQEICVYTQIDKSKECYNLVLGNYSDFSDSQTMQKLLLETFMMKSTIISYAKIKDRFVED